MMQFLRKWLKDQLHFFFWTYFPILLTIIFGVFMANYFPDIAMQAVGVFAIVMMVAVFLLS